MLKVTFLSFLCFSKNDVTFKIIIGFVIYHYLNFDQMLILKDTRITFRITLAKQ
jgi:hypothetical protein